jgi:hypothetical protein
VARPSPFRDARLVTGIFAAAPLAAAGLTALACESVIGAEFGDVREVSCTHAAPPGPPELGGPAGGESAFTVAASDLDLGEGEGPDGPRFLSFGFDLDGVCTNMSQGPSCRKISWAPAIDTDGPDGRDNAVGWMMHQQAPVFGRLVFRSDDLSAGVQKGSVAPTGVFRVTGYNNNPFDDEVRVEWFVPATPCDPETTPGCAGDLPDWDDPNQRIALDLEANGRGEDGAPLSRQVDARAYVNQHVLVAHFRDAPMMRLANAGWHLVDAVMVAPIDSRGIASRPGDVVTLAGRVTAAELLARLPDVTTFVTGQPVCRDEPNYPLVKAYACGVLDLRIAGNAPDEPCDAINFAVQFHVKPVALGDLRPSEPPATCPPGTDPSEETCRTPTETP